MDSGMNSGTTGIQCEVEVINVFDKLMSCVNTFGNISVTI